jgi:SAM-dependent methyltransferase
MKTEIAEPWAGLSDDTVPPYAEMLHAYHISRAAELRALVGTLSLTRADRVLDLACGDACFSLLLAERAGSVVGVDLSPAYLELARCRVSGAPQARRIELRRADARSLPFDDASFDLAWCAQSLYSLPDPLETLREMARVVRPGGRVAVLENDSLHHIIVPWPAELELAVRQAQLRALAERDDGRVHKFYIGRDLSGLLHQAGLAGCRVRSLAVERHAPLEECEEQFLLAHFGQLRRLVQNHLEAPALEAFDLLFTPCSHLYLLRRPDFHMTHIETLAVGQKP